MVVFAIAMALSMINWQWTWPLACAVCRALQWNGGLCPDCSTRLYDLLRPVVRSEKDLNIQSLFLWEEHAVRAVTWWVYGSKHREDPRVWRLPALWTVERFALHTSQPVFVPVPSHKRGNHALGWARALAEYTGGRVAEALIWPPDSGKSSQKQLARNQRRERRLCLPAVGASAAILEKAAAENQEVILVDDVVTTGSTLRAAQCALGADRVKKAWCVWDRPARN